MWAGGGGGGGGVTDLFLMCVCVCVCVCVCGHNKFFAFTRLRPASNGHLPLSIECVLWELGSRQ